MNRVHDRSAFFYNGAMMLDARKSGVVEGLDRSVDSVEK